MPHKLPNFVCEMCDFKCSKESNYKIHIETNKHKMVINGNHKMPTNEPKIFSCICGNIYKYRPGLARHKRICVAVKTLKPNYVTNEDNNDTINDVVLETKIKEKIDSATDKELKDLVKDLIKQNSELMKTINSIIPKIGNTTNNNTNNNTTNNFNLNVFLNEQCKDALNISEFVDSLKITFEDLLYSKKNGLVEGISNVMIRGLKELDIYKRPIHCTDRKRETMYIKDHEKWEKDETHEIMRNTIEKIADKERTALQLWTEENPDWIETERKQMEYLTMLRNISEPIEDEEKNGRKIIRAVSREVIVDK